MFTLQNFEKQPNKVMLQRGKQYHEEGIVAGYAGIDSIIDVDCLF